jgi:hypothetical protein
MIDFHRVRDVGAAQLDHGDPEAPAGQDGLDHMRPDLRQP